jgi:hypothetical protein
MYDIKGILPLRRLVCVRISLSFSIVGQNKISASLTIMYFCKRSSKLKSIKICSLLCKSMAMLAMPCNGMSKFKSSLVDRA